MQTLFTTPVFMQLREIVVQFNEGLIELNIDLYTGETVVCEHTWKMRISYFPLSVCHNCPRSHTVKNYFGKL